ncbi:PIM1 kinase, partial [Grallaria varia]|nr:PIM1 kinase [Grallaria varia]
LQVAIKRVSWAGVSQWGTLPDGTCVPLEVLLLLRVSSAGFGGIVQLLDGFELPDSFALVMEHPERSRDLRDLLRERQFLPEDVAWGLFRQVLEAVRHCSSCGVLHHDIESENITVDVASGAEKLTDFGCATLSKDTMYTTWAG